MLEFELLSVATIKSGCDSRVRVGWEVSIEGDTDGLEEGCIDGVADGLVEGVNDGRSEFRSDAGTVGDADLLVGAGDGDEVVGDSDGY